MKALRRWHGKVSDRGASAVEFALIVPVLLLVVFGIINFGFVFSQQSTLNNAVREGARRAVVSYPGTSPSADPRTCDGIIASVQNQLSALALNPASVKVLVTQDGFGPANGCGSTYQASSFGGSAAHLPCTGSLVNNVSHSLIVQVQYASRLPVAFPPFPTQLTLSAKAVYRCEYN